MTVSANAPLDIGYQITGPVDNPIKNTYTETVKLTNDGTTAVHRFKFVLEGLTPGVTLTNASGTTTNGSPYVTVGTPLAGQSATVTLTFTKTSASLYINYTPEFIADRTSPVNSPPGQTARGSIDAISQHPRPVLPMLAFSLWCLAPAGTARAESVTYAVDVNTTSLAGSSGFIDFQFNPADLSSLSATAGVNNFSTDGTVGLQAFQQGDANGPASGPLSSLSFDNGGAGGTNELTYDFAYGGVPRST